MRIYRFQVRVIQLSVLLAIIVMVFGAVNVWQGKTQLQPVSGDTIVENDPAQNNSLPDDKVVLEGSGTPVNTKIVCLGDSYTYGWPGEQKDSWPAVMAGILKIEVVNAGVVYQNASNLLDRFDKDVVQKQPGSVIIFAGVGDALRGITPEEYKKNVQAMVDKALDNNIKPILALPIPYPGTDTLYNNYREWEISFAQANKLITLDFKEVLFGQDGKILRKYSDDGKYPNKDGYQAMGVYAAQVLQ